MVENALGREVVESRLVWLEFKANKSERLPTDHSNLGEHSESFTWVLKDLKVDWGVTCVDYLDGLIHRFFRRS
jgi:hypothetical protein